MENLRQLAKITLARLFRGLLEGPAIQKFMALADEAEQGDPEKCVAAYSGFCARLYACRGQFQRLHPEYVAGERNHTP